MNATALEGGFAAPAQQSAEAFRQIMEAVARPGKILPIAGTQPPTALSEAAATVLLTLCDPETPIYLASSCDTPEVREWVAFHTGAPFSGPATCAFAVGTWEALIPLTNYPIGTAEYPDRSATLIIEVEELSRTGATLRGPGIKDLSALSLPDRAAFQMNAAQFPLGLDFILTTGAEIAALPRSTEVL